MMRFRYGFHGIDLLSEVPLHIPEHHGSEQGSRSLFLSVHEYRKKKCPIPFGRVNVIRMESRISGFTESMENLFTKSLESGDFPFQKKRYALISFPMQTRPHISPVGFSAYGSSSRVVLSSTVHP
jgi:hypothetical protein